MRKIALVVASLAFCGATQAASPHQQGVAAYLGAADIKTDVGSRSLTISGREIGVRAAVDISHGVFGRVEYGAVNGKKTSGNFDVDAELDDFRIGGGYSFKINDAASVYAEANYVVVSLDETAFNNANGNTLSASSETNGFFIGAGGSFAPLSWLSLYGRAGYVSVEDKDSDDKGNGPDLLAGADFATTDVFGVFGEYRYSKLKFNGVDSDLSGFRGGVRVKF